MQTFEEKLILELDYVNEYLSSFDTILGPKRSHWIICKAGVKTLDADTAERRRVARVALTARIRSREQELWRWRYSALCQLILALRIFKSGYDRA